MKILAFAASNSRKSINKALVRHATDVLQAEVHSLAQVTLLDINDFEMPIYSIDRETENGIPTQAHDFFKAIGDADGLIASFAEHNGSYTAAFKNLFDWTSRIDMKVYQGKPMLVLATSPGRGGAGNVMKTVLSGAPHFGGEVKAHLSVPSFNHMFDVDQGILTDADLSLGLSEAVRTFSEAVKA